MKRKQFLRSLLALPFIPSIAKAIKPDNSNKEWGKSMAVAAYNSASFDQKIHIYPNIFFWETKPYIPGCGFLEGFEIHAMTVVNFNDNKHGRYVRETLVCQPDDDRGSAKNKVKDGIAYYAKQITEKAEPHHFDICNEKTS